MFQGFDQRFVGFGQIDVFADHGDFDGVFRVFDGMDDFFPRGQIRLLYVKLQLLGNDVVDALVVQHFGAFVDAVHVVAANNCALFHVAEQGDFAAFVRGHGSVHAANQDVGLQTDAQHFFNGMLGRLGFDFAGGSNVGNVAQVGEQGVVASQLAAHLTDGFQKRQRFNVADRTADFDDGHIVTCRAFVDAAFDFVGNVRDDLNRAAEVVAAAFFGDDVFVHLPRAEAVAAGHGGVDETFVVSQVEVGFRAVVGDEHFAVLERAHRAGIDVDIRVELEHGHVQTARFEDGGNRSGGDTFSE